MAYIASSDVKQYGGIPDTDTVDDAELTLLIARAQAFVEEYTGRAFQADSDNQATRYYMAAESVERGVLWLDKDLNTVGTDGIVAGTDTLASTDYVTVPRNDKPYYAIRLTAQTPLSWGEPTSDGDYEDAIAVHGQWAYSSDVPADIQHAMIRLVKYFYKLGRLSDETADRPIVLESGAIVQAADFPKDVLSILDFYKYRPVGS
jgi:hypothetical protein